MPSLDVGIVVGGPPCQGFSKLNALREGFGDPRSGGIAMFAQLTTKLREAAPHIEWHSMLENVASMSDSDRLAITQEL